MTPLLEVSGLSVRYGGLTAVEGLTFTVGRGEVVGLIGPNGAGKTTVLNVLAGVTPVDSGRVALGGRDLTGLAPHRVAAAGVARTFQNLGLVGDLDVASTLLLGRHRHMKGGLVADAVLGRRSRRADRAQLTACGPVVETLELGPHLGTRVGDLPLGLRKRVELARALVSEPSLLLADEPTVGMAPAEAAAVLDALWSWRAACGAAIVVVDHDMAMVMGSVDRVLVLDSGRLLAAGPPARVRADPRVGAVYLGGWGLANP